MTQPQSLNDGLGDQLNVTERIQQLEALNWARARERHNTATEAVDLAQEARIAIWRSYEASLSKADPRTWLSAVSHMRLREVAIRQTWFGHTRVHGQPSDPLRNATKASLDDPDFTLGPLEAPDWIDSALISYHAGEIARAISELPPKQRDYIILRFWYGFTPIEIENRFAIDQSAAWTGARRNLRQALAHLA